MKKFLKSLFVIIIATCVVVLVVYAATTIGTNITSDGQLIIGELAHPEYVPNAKARILQTDTDFTGGEVDSTYIGLVAEAASDGTDEAAGVGGIARTGGSADVSGISGSALIGDTLDSGVARGVTGYSFYPHVGGINVGVAGLASGGAENYSFYGSAGDIYNAGNIYVGPDTGHKLISLVTDGAWTGNFGGLGSGMNIPYSGFRVNRSDGTTSIWSGNLDISSLVPGAIRPMITIELNAAEMGGLGGGYALTYKDSSDDIYGLFDLDYNGISMGNPGNIYKPHVGGNFVIYGDASGTQAFWINAANNYEVTATNGIKPGSFTSNPCASLTEGSEFYNSTNHIPCYCGQSNTPKKYDGSACF